MRDLLPPRRTAWASQNSLFSGVGIGEFQGSFQLRSLRARLSTVAPCSAGSATLRGANARTKKTEGLVLFLHDTMIPEEPAPNLLELYSAAVQALASDTDRTNNAPAPSRAPSPDVRYGTGFPINLLLGLGC
jgi:hypothetical protein